MNSNRPTFGVGEAAIPATTSAPTQAPRPELGAVWQKTARSTNKDYLNITLEFKKEKLKELLDAEVDERGNVKVKLVAFHNKFYKGDPRQPNYKIYEELKREQE